MVMLEEDASIKRDEAFIVLSRVGQQHSVAVRLYSEVVNVKDVMARETVRDRDRHILIEQNSQSSSLLKVILYARQG